MSGTAMNKIINHGADAEIRLTDWLPVSSDSPAGGQE
jgi:hypothetical protein